MTCDNCVWYIIAGQSGAAAAMLERLRMGMFDNVLINIKYIAANLGVCQRVKCVLSLCTKNIPNVKTLDLQNSRKETNEVS